nr:IncF plasmid conjugative transfer mating signal transduction protein TraM [Escherichia coli]
MLLELGPCMVMMERKESAFNQTEFNKLLECVCKTWSTVAKI